MATAGKIKKLTKQETCAIQWTSLFQNELTTQRQSLVFVKRMTALAVSSITYLRGIFPEDAYRSRYLEDLCVKVLREDSASLGASKIIKWMMGCFDALEKGYLQIMLIGVHTCPGDPNHIIESYQFRYKYTANGPQMDILRNNSEMQISFNDTKRASILLVRKLFLLVQNLDALPNNVFLTMKLYYYDSVTPPNYEPPGFKEGVCDTLWFEGTAVRFKVGDLQTPFHTMKVQVAAEQERGQKLQKGNHVLEEVKSSQTGATDLKHTEVGMETHKEEDLPSEDAFEKPRKVKTRGKAMLKRKMKREQ